MSDIVKGLRRIAEEGYRFAGDAADEIARLRARLEAAERERDALRAKVEAMEKQEPVGWTTKLALELWKDTLGFHIGIRNLWGDKGIPLYALPGAQGEKMFAWLKRIFDQSTDPVHSCDLYHDKEAGSCVHVDGPLCNFPECSMLADYQQQKEKRND